MDMPFRQPTLPVPSQPTQYQTIGHAPLHLKELIIARGALLRGLEEAEKVPKSTLTEQAMRAISKLRDMIADLEEQIHSLAEIATGCEGAIVNLNTLELAIPLPLKDTLIDAAITRPKFVVCDDKASY